MRRFVWLGSLLAIAATSLVLEGAASAAEVGGSSPSDATPILKGGAETPFVFLTDPTTPRASEMTLGYGIGSASAGAADRPVPADPTSGIVQSVAIGYGITSKIAPFANVLYKHDGSSSTNHQATANAGVRFQLTDPSSAFRFTLIGAGFREFDGAFGSSLRAASSYDFGPFRVAGNLHVEHAFRTGSDPIDVLVLAGVSYRVVDFLRLGAEYVGQDLEDAFEHDEAEGGAKHYVGPNAAIDLAGSSGRVQLVFGPSFAISKTAKGAVLGRAALLVAF